MKGIFNFEELNPVLKDFYTALSIRNSIFDDEYREIISYPSRLPGYCERIRMTEAGRKGCAKCDEDACKRAKALGRAHIYTCHAGLLEAISPIIIEGETVGYALLSHISYKQDIALSIEKAHALNAKYGLTREETATLLTELKSTSAPIDKVKIKAVARILEALVSHVCTKEIIKKKNTSLQSELTSYIDRHISESLNCDTLCEHFRISRSHLFNVSKASFGVGISDYITEKRLTLAKKLLLDGKKTAEVAELCGFTDVCYFSKVFKNKTGLPPAKWRSEAK